jgi:hypothetical protein
MKTDIRLGYRCVCSVTDYVLCEQSSNQVEHLRARVSVPRSVLLAKSALLGSRSRSECRFSNQLLSYSVISPTSKEMGRNTQERG